MVHGGQKKLETGQHAAMFAVLLARSSEAAGMPEKLEAKIFHFNFQGFKEIFHQFL